MKYLVLIVFCMLASAISSNYISSEFQYIFGYFAGTVGSLILAIGGN